MTTQQLKTWLDGFFQTISDAAKNPLEQLVLKLLSIACDDVLDALAMNLPPDFINVQLTAGADYLFSTIEKVFSGHWGLVMLAKHANEIVDRWINSNAATASQPLKIEGAQT